jgi:hypothetical protein
MARRGPLAYPPGSIVGRVATVALATPGDRPKHLSFTGTIP